MKNRRSKRVIQSSSSSESEPESNRTSLEVSRRKRIVQSSSSSEPEPESKRTSTEPSQPTVTTPIRRVARKSTAGHSKQNVNDVDQKATNSHAKDNNVSSQNANPSASNQLNFNSQQHNSNSQKRGRTTSSDRRPAQTNNIVSTPSTSKRGDLTPAASDDSSDEATTSTKQSHSSPYPKRTIEKKFYSPLKKNEPLTSETEKQLVNNCIHYVLIADQKKCAIKKSDIVKHVFKSNLNTKVSDTIIKKANITLKQVFGLELMEVENKNKQLLIYNNLQESLEFSKFSDKENAERGLIAYLLTLIYMNGNSMKEKDLWLALEPFELLPDTKKHPYFGDVKKFITHELVHQMYLDYKKIPDSDPIEHIFTSGMRAKLEVDKMDLLKLACEAYGDCNPEDWILQYKEATESHADE